MLNIKTGFTTGLMTVLLVLSGCASSPQKIDVAPVLALDELKGVVVPIELVISDKRENKNILGYRNAKKEGTLEFNDSLAKSLGETIKSALIYQGIDMSKGPQPYTRLEIQVDDLTYSSPDETWVSNIELSAEILLVVARSGASIKKRFKANRTQEVVTAPNKEFNEKFLNSLLSELLNKALNDKEIVNFLK